MLRQCLPVASLRPRAGKGEAEVGRGAAWSPGRGQRGRREAELAGPGRHCCCCCCCWSRSNCTATSPRSFPFISPLLAPAKQPQFVCNVSPPPALPPPRPTPAESPRTGAPRARPCSRGPMLPEAGRELGGYRGVKGFLGILGMRPCSVRRLLAAGRSWGAQGRGAGKQRAGRLPPSPDGRAPGTALPGTGVPPATRGGSPTQGKAPGLTSVPPAGRIPGWSEAGQPLGAPG